MLFNMLIGLSTMGLCLVSQSLLLVAALRYYARHGALVERESNWWALLVLNAVMSLLVIGNMLQIAIWATVFRLLGEFETIGKAAYHSAVNFSSLGYGDIVMSERFKLLGPMEAVNGVLMIGISTAMLIAVFQDMLRKVMARRREPS